MRLKHYLYVLSFLGCGVLSAQQQSPMSIFNQHQTYYNPAATGNKEVLAANFFTRQAMVGWGEGAPSLQVFSVHAPMRNPKVALGVLVERDAYGAHSNTGLHLHYAYRIGLGKNNLSFGLRMGISNGGQEITGRDEMIDPAFADENMRFWMPNFGFGILYYGKQYWAGVSLPRIFGYESNAAGNYAMNFNITRHEYFLMGGASFKFNPNLGIEPSLLFKYGQSLGSSLGINALMVYQDRYKAGLGYRSSDKVIIMIISMDINPQFGFGYSYDYGYSKKKDTLANYSSGSHEIHIHYTFGYKVNASNPRGF